MVQIIVTLEQVYKSLIDCKAFVEGLIFSTQLSIHTLTPRETSFSTINIISKAFKLTAKCFDFADTGP
jgi:hypothetical protein